MPRIAGVDIPENKKIRYSLRYIYGIGPQTADDILAEAGINPDIKAKDLSETDVGQIIAYIEAGIIVEGTLRRQVQQIFSDCEILIVTEATAIAKVYLCVVNGQDVMPELVRVKRGLLQARRV